MQHLQIVQINACSITQDFLSAHQTIMYYKHLSLTGCGGDMETVSRDNRNADRSPDSDLDNESLGDESDIRYVQNIDDWLALRVQGGAKTWRFSLCLNTPATSQ